MVAALSGSRLLRQLKSALAASCAVLALLLLARLWSIDGMLRRVTIDGPSMAPAYCGAHYKVQCGDCGFPFRCDAEHLPSDRLAACPNCGFGENSLDAALAAPPDHVLIDRWPVFWQSPTRGDVVAIQTPDDGGGLAVKRVAGLPGERLAIDGGDLMSGQQILRKSAADFRALRLLVHDNNYRPQTTPGLLARWRASSSNSRWKPIGNGFRIEPSTAADAPLDWLEYEHWSCTSNPRLRGVATAISDNDGFNQGETHRPLNPMSDVFLSCRLQTFGTGRFALAAIDGDQRFEVEIEPRKQVVLRSGGQSIITQPLRQLFSRNSVDVEFGLCDQQVILAIDGRTVLRHPYDRRGSNTSAMLHPLSIGAATIGLEVNDLRVWRDIYYLGPQGLPRIWSVAAKLGADEFVLLGDNQPVSIDSRHWQSPTVARIHILGRVYRPFWIAQ
jgi:hypothetical protein